MRTGNRLTRWMACWLLIAAAPGACRTAVAADEYIWFEGEDTTSRNYDVGTAGWGNKQYLSEEKWLNIMINANEVEARIPEGGIIFTYEFEAKAPGNYEVWNRVGHERVRSDFDWRMDDGEWQTIPSDMLTTDLMDISFWCEVAWLKMGQAQLQAGKHALHIRHVVTRDAEGKPKRLLYDSDAFCLYNGTFRPNGAFKPDAQWQTDEDRAAMAQVFQAKAPEAPGERAVTPLAGTWQIARADEQVINDRLGPIPSLPPAGDLYWKAIAVPGDRNTLRPELIFCHRYFYRTRVNVPAAQDSSYFLHFPSTNMVATVFVNGKLCGWNKAPFAAWDCDITEAVKPGEINEIWVGIKDTYYGLTGETRAMFNLPPTLLDENQGVAHKFDMPVWHHRRNGILEPPTLVTTGLAYTADVFAIPSVSKKQLGLEVTVKNPTGAALDLTIRNEVAPLEGGPAEKTFAPTTIRVPAGAQTVLKLTEAWENPKLWWPDDPRQYDVVTRISMPAGNALRVVDVHRTKFGFRQWDWQGTQFALNGVPWQGRADLTHHHTSDPELAAETWKKNGQTMFRFWATKWGGLGMNDTLDFMDSHGMPVRRSGIFDGEMASYGLATRVNGQKVANKPLFDNCIEQMTAQVRGERNHPSVFIWSVENEVLFINANNLGNKDVVEPELARCIAEVMKIDPTRPAMVDGGRALMDMSLPVNGCHYNELADRDLPDQAYTLEKMMDGRFHGGWPMRKDRPVFLGEAFYAVGRKPSGFAAVGGEVAFLGRSGTKEGVARLCRMLSEGYRWKGLAAFHYWLSDADSTGHYNSWQPVCALSRQWNWTFAGGAQVKRTIKVLNDTRHPDPIEMGWELRVDGKLIQQDASTFNIGPGLGEVTEISFQLPRVTQRTPGQFILTCSRGGEEVFREVKDIRVIDPDAAPRPQVRPGGIAVLDPQGTVKARLTARGIPFTEVARVDSTPPQGARVLIIGPDALSDRESTDPKWTALAAAGMRLLVLEQRSPLHYQAVPADLEPSGRTGRIAFSENLQHPVFEGLDQPDFFTWSGDHVVYRNAYRKASKGARSLAQCDDELKYSALAEVPVGEGLMLLSQFAIGGKLPTDPVARRMFDNMVNYCLDYKLVQKATAVVMADNTPTARMLKDIKLTCDKVPDVVQAMSGRHQIIVAQADPATLKKLAQNRAALDAFTARGGYLMLMGLTPAGLADFNRIVGVQHLLRPFGRERIHLPGARDPILSGLTTRDIVMESAEKIFAWRGDRWMADDVFTHIVDFDDIAPFAEWPPPTYWMQDDVTGPGGDHWPRNMVNGFVTSDGWRYIFSILLFRNEPAKWTLKLPRQEQVTGFSIAPNAIYHKLTRVRLSFDTGQPVEFDILPDDSRQDFEIGARPTRSVTVELADWQQKGTQDVIGVDNIWLHVKRSDDFRRRVIPLLNVGGLVRYKLGNGGIVLNQLNIQDRETVPENRTKKATITATLLQNLGAVFGGQGAIRPGQGLKYQPIPLGDKCNQFLAAGQDRWFKDGKGRALDHFPIGEQKLADVTYLIRDFKTSPLPSCIMLQGNGPNAVAGAEWDVRDIAVNRKANAVFFLHTFNLTDNRKLRQEPMAFRYVVHYADGQSVDVPVRCGQQVGHWAVKAPAGLSGAALAWAAPFKNDPAEQAAVYSMQWNNPRPDVAIKSIDIGYDPEAGRRAARGNAAVLAITAATRIK